MAMTITDADKRVLQAYCRTKESGARLNITSTITHPAHVTGRIDISAIAGLGAPAPWRFVNTAVPLNERLRVPRGRGRF
jgi:hypothetical protein